MGDELCMGYKRMFDVDVKVCRFYNVYGPHQLVKGDYCTLIGIYETLYKENKPLLITGDGEQRRDFTHVDDIVDGLVKCSENIIDANGKVFELGRGKNYSVNEIAAAFGDDYPTEYVDPRPGEMRETLCVDSLARKVLKWNPKKDVIDYVKEKVN